MDITGTAELRAADKYRASPAPCNFTSRIILCCRTWNRMQSHKVSNSLMNWSLRTVPSTKVSQFAFLKAHYFKCCESSLPYSSHLTQSVGYLNSFRLIIQPYIGLTLGALKARHSLRSFSWPTQMLSQIIFHLREDLFVCLWHNSNNLTKSLFIFHHFTH